ncbi:MAG: hypothetical protein ACOY5C_06940 [Pseudomonadota bacterium]|uniref:hypothetical protein n=1 Tax=Thermithiobacillus tepidarius TaxID=929 RepID=UPI0006878DA4|nr:hypothetical protein [Thermithiobacillus tepidarius]
MSTTTMHATTAAASARRAASAFHYGNLAAALIPGFGVLWFGLSMLTFAVNSHHPDPRVLDFNRRGARNFYPLMAIALLFLASGFGGFTGALDVANAFKLLGLAEFGQHLRQVAGPLANQMLDIWMLFILVMLPLTLRDLYAIRKTKWQELPVVHPE